MKRIGVISDTHGSFEPKFAEFFANCDELWHLGDWGDISVLEKMLAIAPVRGVYGNIDGQDIRKTFPEYQIFDIERFRVLMIHIGGYPGRYEPLVRQTIELRKPDLFLSGHSHILKVINDKKRNLLHINPGAAGNSGFHKLKTAVRFVLNQGEITDFQILEVDRNQLMTTNSTEG